MEHLQLPQPNFDILKSRSDYFKHTTTYCTPNSPQFSLHDLNTAVLFLADMDPSHQIDSLSHTNLAHVALFLQSDHLLQYIIQELMTPNSSCYILQVLLNANFDLSNPHVSFILNFYDKVILLPKQKALDILFARGARRLTCTISRKIRKMDHFWSFHSNPICIFCDVSIAKHQPYCGPHSDIQFTYCCYKLSHKHCFHKFLSENSTEGYCPYCNIAYIDQKPSYSDSTLNAIHKLNHHRDSQKIARSTIWPSTKFTSNM